MILGIFLSGIVQAKRRRMIMKEKKVKTRMDSKMRRIREGRTNRRTIGEHSVQQGG